jgi:hypothetical protein
MKTDKVKDYKIVYSYYGREIVDGEPIETQPIDIPDEPEEEKPIHTQPHPHDAVPEQTFTDNSVDNDANNNTIDVNETKEMENTSTGNSNVTNTTNSTVVANNNINGDFNLGQYVISIKNSIVNFYVSYTK